VRKLRWRDSDNGDPHLLIIKCVNGRLGPEILLRDSFDHNDWSATHDIEIPIAVAKELVRRLSVLLKRHGGSEK